MGEVETPRLFFEPLKANAEAQRSAEVRRGNQKRMQNAEQLKSVNADSAPVARYLILIILFGSVFSARSAAPPRLCVGL